MVARVVRATVVGNAIILAVKAIRATLSTDKLTIFPDSPTFHTGALRPLTAVFTVTAATSTNVAALIAAAASDRVAAVIANNVAGVSVASEDFLDVAERGNQFLPMVINAGVGYANDC